MNKFQAVDDFWNGFGLPAYDEITVPDNAQMPYITYDISTSDLDDPVVMTASLWYESMSWREISEKVEEISEYITKMYPPAIKIDKGRLYITKGFPFAQRMSEPSDPKVRRMILNIQTEYLTAF